MDSNLPQDNVQAVTAPVEVEMPEVDPAFGYLLGLFFRSRQAKSTGMGLVSLDWSDIRAFRMENNLDLSVWEREVILSMSEAYVSEYYKASDPQHKPPYALEVETEEVDVEKEIKKGISFRDTLRALGRKK